MIARHSFLLKLAAALLLVILADQLFWFQRAGSTIGLFALAVLIATLCVRLEILLHWPSRIAAGAALCFALSLAADPGPLALLLYLASLTLMALLPRTARFDDAWRWAQRLVVHGLLSPIGLPRDYLAIGRARRRRGPIGLRSKAFVLILPLAGSVLFLSLFAQANPLIGDMLARVDFWPDFDILTVARAFFWGAVLTGLWSVLRPPRFALGPARPGRYRDLTLPGVSIASVTISLLAFNLIFALQNGLDLAFLWSGAPLPEGMTLAEYAHRGAYPLIATALLAGLFVLVALRPGAPTAESRPIRLLVTLWIAQNLLLVASTMLRTLDYVGAYSLTVLRIAALIWMALVALGLALICYRLLRGRSGAWLINANMLAAAFVLAACCWTDLGAIAATWNVRHAREAGGEGAAIDLCYLHELGPSALLPLIELESRPLPAELRERVQWLRSRMMDRLAENQRDWHGWTLLNARRLAAAQALAAERRLPHHRDEPRLCDGRVIPPPPQRDAPQAEAVDAADAGNEAAPATPPAPPPAPAPARPLTARPER
jgi:hypothetical protein